MKKITCLSMFLLLLGGLLPVLRAQPVTSSPTTMTTATTQKQWDMVIGYTNVIDANKQFSSDALDLEMSYYLLENVDFEVPFLWDQATVSLGPIGAIRVNSGITNSHSYSEQIMSWSTGVSSLINFPQSHLNFDVAYGRLYSYYTLKSGYTADRSNAFINGKIAYHQYAGRLQGNTLFPTWNLVLAGGLPWYDQKVFYWGVDEFEQRQNESGQNLNSIHGQVELGLIDFAIADDAVVGMKARGLGGKYNANVKYWGLGTGLDLVFDNFSVLYVNFDYVWGWQNSHARNWNLGVGIHYAFFQKIF